jgi:hypothetical protein
LYGICHGQGWTSRAEPTGKCPFLSTRTCLTLVDGRAAVRRTLMDLHRNVVLPRIACQGPVRTGRVYGRERNEKIDLIGSKEKAKQQLLQRWYDDACSRNYLSCRC